MSFFEKHLTVWVILCMVVGIVLGKLCPAIPILLGQLELYHVSIPTTILLWIMIYPMMLKIDFQSIKNIKNNPKGLWITWFVNWIIKPLSMYLIASVFFFILFKTWIHPNLASEYLAGSVLLGSAPCTAMVFVWSKLTHGDSAYTLVQVASNDLIILIAYIPIVSFLLNVGQIQIPWQTLFLSIVLYIVFPLIFSFLTRKLLKEDYLNETFIPSLDKYTMIGLLLTLVIIFSFQGEKILEQPFNILLIAIPLTLQTFFIFGLTLGMAYLSKLPYSIAAPCSMIGASNFFELAVAVAISLFGLSSGATLTTVVGVLVEVPVMLTLVKIANALAYLFKKG